MRYRGGLTLSQHYGKSCCVLHLPSSLRPAVSPVRFYCAPQQNPKNPVVKAGSVQQHTANALKNLAEVGRQWAHNSAKTASATVNYWWEKYEEFVGLTEVREAQAKVTEAEKAFMVARGMVREAHGSLEALQGRLKEVRDRLDRVSREEAHYLELATLEHRLLQEERRLRTAYENAEGAEREKFGLFSAGVRESHEKERARAERTKNWSVIGSVLGALIGVMGSTYINRVRLQELRALLLEAQKGPASLQEAIRLQAGAHKAQQEELQGLIGALSAALTQRTVVSGAGVSPSPAPSGTPHSPLLSTIHSVLKDVQQSSQRAQALTEGLHPQMAQLEQTVHRVQSELRAMRTALSDRPAADKPVVGTEERESLVFSSEGVMQGLAQTEQRLGAQISKTSLYSTALTYTAFALTIPLLYLIFKGN